MARPIDALARDMALRRFGLPPCLHVPVAAKDLSAIVTFVGEIETTLDTAATPRAVVVHPFDPHPADERLPIWSMDGVAVLHSTRQVWVHVDYKRYREAFRAAFPAQDLFGLVVDHVMNRRVARLKGFSFVRLIAISRASNSSSGGLAERWSAEYHGRDAMLTRSRHASMKIQYADLADIVKMMDRKTGGSLQDPVNEAQAWVDPTKRRDQ